MFFLHSYSQSMANKKVEFFDLNQPNPVNKNPRFLGDYPKIEPHCSTIESQPGWLRRPPKSPDDALGPYFQFLTTDLD